MNLNEAIAENIELILDKLGVDYTEHYNRLSMPCPIHGGTNPSGCCVYHKNDSYIPNFKCYTNGCHLENGSSLVSFLSRILKKNKEELKTWLKNINIESQEDELGLAFTKQVNILTKSRKSAKYKISKATLNNLDYSAHKFIKEKIKPETLKKFGVGICKDRKKLIYNYIVVPVFNDTNEYIVGYSARTIYQKCLICNQYHHENGVCYKNCQQKWKHASGFYSGSFLYNFWNAKKHIIKTNRVLLVEGPKDVWKLWENGITNVVGVFGNSLSEDQKIILEKLPINTIGIFFDPDSAGNSGALKLKNYLDRFYNVIIINYHKQPSLCEKDETLKLFRKYK